MAADLKKAEAEPGAEAPRPAEVAIDTSETTRGTQKVELDLEDAPFLEEEEEAPAEPEKPTASVSLETPPEEKKPLDKKKLILIAVAALVLLIGAGIAVKLVFFGAKDSPKLEETKQTAAAEEQAANQTAAEPEPPEIQVRLDPFWVEQRAEQDQIRFLIVRILVGTKDPSIAKEFEARLLPARNAIFYYLKNKDVHFLADEENTEKLKEELLLVINQYVTDGKFDTLMFEEYVVK